MVSIISSSKSFSRPKQGPNLAYIPRSLHLKRDVSSLPFVHGSKRSTRCPQSREGLCSRPVGTATGNLAVLSAPPACSPPSSLPSEWSWQRLPLYPRRGIAIHARARSLSLRSMSPPEPPFPLTLRGTALQNHGKLQMPLAEERLWQKSALRRRLVQVLLCGPEQAHGRRLVIAPVLLVAPVGTF